MYGSLVSLKNWLYDREVIETVKVSCPVLSVGNLRMGGVGKTPFVSLILRELAKKHRIAVVSRNYKAKGAFTEKVDPAHEMAGEFFGDEPVMIARDFPQVSVFVGPKKYKTAALAVQTSQPELLIVDDGFQHRKLHRDLDCVILDPSDFTARVLPLGPLREGLPSLMRADWVVVNAVGATDGVDQWRERLPNDVRERVRLAGVRGVLTAPDLKTGMDGKIAAFAGIARAERFREALEKIAGRPLDRFWAFPDHHRYEDSTLESLEQWMRANPSALVFTTEKDAVKIKKWLDRHAQTRVASLRLEFVFGGDFIDVLGRLVETHGK